MPNFIYLKHNDIDVNLWDECLNNSKNGIIYGLSWYLDITSPGWEAIVQITNEKYGIAMPIPVFRKFGIKYIKQPVMSQQLGIFSKDGTVREGDLHEIFTILKKKFRYIQRYELNTGNTEIFSNQLPDISKKTFYTHHLDLNRSYREIAAAYKPDRKWRINKAKRSNILIRETEDIDTLISIFDKNVAHKIYGILGEKYEYRILRALYKAAQKRGLTTFLAAHNLKGEILAMGLFFTFNRKIIYIFNASTVHGKQKNAISLVVDEVLKDNANRPLCFDFESPEVPKVAEFYHRFGSEPMPFASISYNNLPGILRFTKNFRQFLYKSVMMKL